MARSFARLLSRLNGVEEHGAGYRALCPAHNDHTPSLLLTLKDDGKLLVHCQAGCEQDAVLTKLGLTGKADLFRWEPGSGKVHTTAAAPAELVGGPTVAALRRYVESCARRLRDAGPDSLGAKYLRDRFGVELELAARLLLGVDPGGKAEQLEWRSDTFAAVPRLVVPFFGTDCVVRGLQGRALTGHRVRWCGLSNPDGARWATTAIFLANTGLDEVLVCEGPGDALTAVGAGYDAVAIRGASLAEAGARAEGLADWLRGRRVVLVGDNDAAGQRFNAALGAAFSQVGVQVHTLVITPGAGDLTEWRGMDPAAFQGQLEEAVAAAPLWGEAAPSAPADDEGEAEAQKPVPADELPLTDLGNAERLKRQLDPVRYSPEAGFYLWDNYAGWTLDGTEAVRAEAHDVTRAMLAEAEKEIEGNKDHAEAKKLRGHALRSQSTRSIDAMVRELSALRGVAVSVDDMDGAHDLLAFRNGVVDLRTGELQSNRPELLITRRLDLEYKPEAECPRWEQFLREIFPSAPGLPEYMARLVGYGITGHTSEQCFAVLWGTGANGKSVLTDTLTHVFRAVTATTPFATFEAKGSGGIPNDLAALKGARLVMAAEGEQGKPMAESVLKRLTGRDYVSARFMRKEFFEFRPTFLLMLATNHKPRFKGQDDGIWRRVKLVPFARYFDPDERDHYLAERLQAEAEGIAAWAVRGAGQWYREGLKDPAVVADATRGYREASDLLAGFYPGVLEPAPGERCLAAHAFQAYTKWCEEEGLPDREVWRRTTFYEELESRGVVRRKMSEGMTLFGVRLVTVAPSVGRTTVSDGRIGSLFTNGQ